MSVGKLALKILGQKTNVIRVLYKSAKLDLL